MQNPQPTEAGGPSDDTHETDEAPPISSDTFECAICWQDMPHPPATLPCCGKPPEGSSTVYCMRCLEVICESGVGGVGRCPTCQGFMQKAPDGQGLVKSAGIDECGVCHQLRPIGERLRGTSICGACSIGIRRPLAYECKQCQRVQRIPHPMYRYQQEGPATYGNNTWFCRPCQDFTHWRIHPREVALVPADDSPESWGNRDEWFAQIRAQRMLEAATGDGVGRSGRPAPVRAVATRELLLGLAVLGALLARFLWM